MAGGGQVRETGERIERLLADLRTELDPPAFAAVEDLVACVVELYGAGLARILPLVPDAVDRLIADPLVESLLLLHDLHPLDVDRRIERALDGVRPYLGSHAGGVEYLGVDDAGVAHLRLQGSCDGCASSTRTVQLAIEGAIEAAAPEVTAIDVEGVAEPSLQPLLQIGLRPPGTDTRPPVGNGARLNDWAVLGQPPPARDSTRVASVAGTTVLLADVGGSLYAYLDRCPACAGSLEAGVLHGTQVSCPRCGHAYDVRRAGAGTDGGADHLDPIPLVVDGRGVRLAVTAGVGG